MIKVSVLLADGFEEIEALTAVDLLRRARIYVDTISITDDYTVHGHMELMCRQKTYLMRWISLNQI